ncbi:MAG: c-type cytochrome [Gammaproteobacteria bacterium]
MKRGEKVIYSTLGMVVLLFFGLNLKNSFIEKNKDPGIPYYSTASKDLSEKGAVLINRENCRECHSLWTLKDLMRGGLPAPALDGIGSIRTEDWLYTYFSAKNPQSILQSRLKKEYRMPSYSNLPENERKTLASFLASLKVEDWYLEETKKAEYEKLTGKAYPDDESTGE